MHVQKVLHESESQYCRNLNKRDFRDMEATTSVPKWAPHSRPLSLLALKLQYGIACSHRSFAGSSCKLGLNGKL